MTAYGKSRVELAVKMSEFVERPTDTDSIEHGKEIPVNFSCFLSRVPKPLPEWERILYPFQVNVWISFILGFFLMGFLLNAFARAGRASGGEKNDLQSLSFSCLYTCGVHLSEGQALLPIRGGTRVFISFLWLYTIIITTGYCSNLTAFLTVSREPSTLDTIKALAESSLQVAGLGHFFGKALASSSNPYLKTLSTKYTAYEHHEDVWPLVLDGAAVNLESRRYLVYVMETQFTHHGVSTVRLVKETFAPYSIGLTTQRSSPLKRKFDLLLNKMVEAGLVQYWFVESLRIAKQEADRKRQSQQDYDDDKEKASGSGSTTENGSKEEVQQEIPSETGVRSIGLRHMQGNFFALVIGFFGATLIFLGELMFGEKPPGRG